MVASFQLFGVVHLLILAAIPLIAGALVWLARHDEKTALQIRLGLGILITFNELIWYGYVLRQGWASFPYGLPLNLCDVALWLTVAALLTLKPAVVELAYFWGIAGSGMAILTPDLGVSLPSYPAIQFFTAHGGVIIALLYMAWKKLSKPRVGSWLRAFMFLNCYAAAIALFNIAFKTNYFYLCEKPASASLLDYMGPWPVYIIVGELFALGIFALLYVPFRKATPKQESK
ncbi:MAG: TIGR02206 family membrane protein [Ignavibacteriales bacterium]|nr:TIGR02206 family membrane protein [Ignavibacteriales bacterium]MBI3786966.1 TIGR02206 family membrane protein [Ignavibacteriales bacterium]